MKDIYDITIIGGGPVGMYTVFYAHLRQAKVKIIESLHQLGGQPAILYPEKAIYDIPAYSKIDGEHLTLNLQQQLERFNTTICLDETVLNIEKKDEVFEIKTTTQTHYSKTIILSFGNGAFKPRTLDLEGMDTFKNIKYHVNNISQYSHSDIVVLGGGDSAVDWSLAFNKIAKTTTIVHRRDEFRALEHSVEELKKTMVNILTPYIPIQLKGENKKLNSIVLENVKTKDTKEIPVDYLFVNYGFSSNVGNLKNWGLELKRNTVLVDTKQETSIPGIFAVGDCCTYDGRVNLIATGFGEAPIAVNHAIHFINPKQRVQPMHSSSLFN